MMRPQAWISTPSDGVVTGEDGKEHLLPSSFGVRARSGEAMAFEIDLIDMRVSQLEESIAKRSTE